MRREAKERKYRLYKMLIVAIISALGAIRLVNRQPVAAAVVIIIGAGFVWGLKNRYREFNRVDERIIAVSGRAAWITFRLFSLGALALVMAELILESLGMSIPGLQGFAYTLSYFVCGLVLMYTLSYAYYAKRM
jgi:uncharacterized membrane protein